ncbi:hypothetical protein BIW11_13482 [Tropilaelaps mercedesae]|uniref:Uncharacterized protein n=1 Tax=Tropilaelaps mercedesae TaxID=418985 RepID=A0A1V9X275_9ACAR|nr:hypothetical protein BIW11_13482 [Tropilaelaps mercedesae]
MHSNLEGWSPLGDRNENELNATFSAVSLYTRNPYTGKSSTLAAYGHPFHFSFTTSEEDCAPSIHFKVLHFEPDTDRFYTLGEGKCVVHCESGVLRVPLVRQVPKSLLARLRERFLGGEPVLTGIVVNQTHILLS